jgi:hypothetical protein
MFTAIGVTLLLGIGIGLFFGVPLGRWLERSWPRDPKGKQRR